MDVFVFGHLRQHAHRKSTRLVEHIFSLVEGLSLTRCADTLKHEYSIYMCIVYVYVHAKQSPHSIEPAESRAFNDAKTQRTLHIIGCLCCTKLRRTSHSSLRSKALPSFICIYSPPIHCTQNGVADSIGESTNQWRYYVFRYRRGVAASFHSVGLRWLYARQSSTMLMPLHTQLQKKRPDEPHPITAW